MEVDFQDASLDRLETDASFTGGHSPSIVKSYRKKMQVIRGAPDERDIRALKSLHFEKLRSPRENHYSIRLNDKWRLTFGFSGKAPNKRVVVIAIEDYH